MWAKMQLDRICTFQTELEIRAQLERHVLLSSLDGTYQELWDATQAREWTAWIHDMLAWILFGLTPLSANTIIDATATYRGDMGYNTIPDTASLLRLCHGFVANDSHVDVPLVIQHTAGRFLKMQPEFSAANEMITMACLAKLSRGVDKFNNSDFCNYAALHWQQHVRSWDHITEDRGRLLLWFLGNPVYMGQQISFHQIRDPKFLANVSKSGHPCDIMVNSKGSVALDIHGISAIFFSLPVVLRFFLKQMPHLGSPRLLALAAFFGDIPICRELLQASVNPNTFEQDMGDAKCWTLDNHEAGCWTFLHIAAAAGHKQIVQLLLEHGAHVNCEDEKGHTAMEVASIAGHKDVVSVLQAGKKLPLSTPRLSQGVQE